MPSHVYVRGSFSSSGFSKSGAERNDTEEGVEEFVDACLDYGEALAISQALDSESGIFKTASSLFGFYDRPEPSFGGCFWPVDHGLGRAQMAHEVRSSAVVAPYRADSGNVTEKHQRHLDKVLKEIRRGT